MLLGQNLAVGHGLNSGVIMILMNLAVNGSLGLIDTRGLDVLGRRGACDCLVDGSVMCGSTAGEFVDSGSC